MGEKKRGMAKPRKRARAEEIGKESVVIMGTGGVRENPEKEGKYHKLCL